jgi:NCS1 family nucleobase:cation symporter-1
MLHGTMDKAFHDDENEDGGYELGEVAVSEPLLSEQTLLHEPPKPTKQPSSSRGRCLLRKLEISPGEDPRTGRSMLTSHDLKPVESERRQWGVRNFVFFWIADSFNINTWMIASVMITGDGLSWWQAWVCIWIGYLIAACFICLTGRIGATYHISFPVATRASFGVWGALWPVLNRTFMSCIWYVDVES